MYLPCKSHLPPIHRNGLEAKEERTYNGGRTKAKLSGVILLKRKKQKVFRGGITPIDIMCNIFIDYQHVIFGVIPLKVLHQFREFGVIVV
jgi:hypothetical protein